MTFVKASLLAGNSKKTSEPYSFYKLQLLDDEGIYHQINLSKDLCADSKTVEILKAAKLGPCVVDLFLHPKGFNLGATVVKISF